MQVASLKCVLHICISVSKSALHFADVFKMSTLCAIFLPFLSFFHFQLSLLKEPRMPFHSVIYHTRSAFTHMEHVTFQ